MRSRMVKIDVNLVKVKKIQIYTFKSFFGDILKFYNFK